MFRRARDERGVSALETMISFTTIIVLIVGLLQMGLFLYAKLSAQSVANDAAGVARRYDGTAGAGQSVGQQQLRQLTGQILTTSHVDVTRGDRSVSVAVTGEVRSLIPGMRWQFRQSAGGEVERAIDPEAEGQ